MSREAKCKGAFQHAGEFSIRGDGQGRRLEFGKDMASEYVTCHRESKAIVLFGLVTHNS